MGIPAIKHCKGAGNCPLRSRFTPVTPTAHLKWLSGANDASNTILVWHCNWATECRATSQGKQVTLLPRAQSPCGRCIKLLAKERGQWQGLQAFRSRKERRRSSSWEATQLQWVRALRRGKGIPQRGSKSGWPTLPSLHTKISTCSEKHKTHTSRLGGAGGRRRWISGGLISPAPNTVLCVRGSSNISIVRACWLASSCSRLLRSPKPLCQHSPASGHTMRVPRRSRTWTTYTDPITSAQWSTFSLPPETAQLKAGDVARRKGWARASLQSPRKIWVTFFIWASVHQFAGTLYRIPNPPIKWYWITLLATSGKPEHKLKLSLNQCPKNSCGGGSIHREK